MTDDDIELRRVAARRADVKLAFRSHLMAYVVVNGALVAINLLTSPGYFWAGWPMFGWGIGLASHAMAVYMNNEGLRDRMIEEELEKLRKTRS